MIDRNRRRERWALIFRARQLQVREHRRMQAMMVARIHAGMAQAIAAGLVQLPMPSAQPWQPTVH